MFEYTKPERRNILLSEYKTIYFFIPKVASSSLKRICASLLKIDQDSKFHKINFPSLLRNSLQKKDNYFKFAFVRNPYDRLVSCYCEKVVLRRAFGQKDFWEKKTFSDFIRIVCNMTDKEMNVHFRPQYLTLIDENGELFIDFIGKLENIEEDFKKIKRIAGFSEDLILSHQKKTGHAHYRKYYTEELKNLVNNRYKKDLEIFDYSF